MAQVPKNPRNPLKQMNTEHRTAARKDPYQDVQGSPSAPVSYRLGDLNVEADRKLFKRSAPKRSHMKATVPRTARQVVPPRTGPIPVSRQGLPPVPSVWAGGATIPTTTTALGALGLLKLKTAASLAFSRSKRSADEVKLIKPRDAEPEYMKYFKRKYPPFRESINASKRRQQKVAHSF